MICNQGRFARVCKPVGFGQLRTTGQGNGVVDSEGSCNASLVEEIAREWNMLMTTPTESRNYAEASVDEAIIRPPARVQWRTFPTEGYTSNTHDQSSGSFLSSINEAFGYCRTSWRWQPCYNLSSHRQLDIVDRAGSLNTWPVSVNYDSGFFSGIEHTDTRATLGSGFTITEQSIGVASASNGLTGFDGILGIGPLDLTEGTLTNEARRPSRLQGKISQLVVGISFEPTTLKMVTNGELTFSETNATKYTGSLAYTPLTTTYPASTYWGIDESITYGSTTILSATAGVVDTGTIIIYTATDTGFLGITLTQYNALKNLNFNIANTAYFLTPNG
ncbi:aspartic peptidase domain-containing protein [Suillus ampliporus]|nr:aspartic peptidase domain-containing protein [Suillus ampliporus]